MNTKHNSNEPDICPCIDCILIPMCRHKRYIRLKMECSLLEAYIGPFKGVVNRDQGKMNHLQKVLNPTTWSYEVHKEHLDDFPIVFDTTQEDY